MLIHLDEYVIVKRLSYTNDKSSMSTIFTNVIASVQQNQVEVSLSGDGYASQTYTVFMDNSRTVLEKDVVVTTDGRYLEVMGVKRITAGSEPFQQLSCEENQS